MSPSDKEKVREQFGRQAERFSRWSVTRNEDYLTRYGDFMALGPGDLLLDVACGTGEFCHHAAERTTAAVGGDLSAEMIAVAAGRPQRGAAGKAEFLVHDADHLPFDDGSFTVVVCKSALHHMRETSSPFGEMVRVCREGGRISVQDIVAFADPEVNRFFEEFERSVDRSHHRALGRDEVQALFTGAGIPVTDSMTVEVPLHAGDYIDHAFQDGQGRERALRLVDEGRRREKTAPFFFEDRGEIFFRREVILVLGEKRLRER